MSAPQGKPEAGGKSNEGTKRDVKIAIAISFFGTVAISLIFLMNAGVGKGLSTGGILVVATVVFVVALGIMRLVARVRGAR